MNQNKLKILLIKAIKYKFQSKNHKIKVKANLKIIKN